MSFQVKLNRFVQVRPDPRIFAKPSLHESASGPRIQSASGPELRNRRPPRSAGIRIRLPGKNKAKNCTVRRDRNLGSASPPRRDSHQAPGEKQSKKLHSPQGPEFRIRIAAPPGSASPPGEKQSKKLQSPQQLQIRIRIAPAGIRIAPRGKTKQKTAKSAAATN